MKTFSLNCRSTKQADIDKHDNKIRALAEKFKTGEKIYVKFTEYADERRTGSIAYLTNFSIREEVPYSYYSRFSPTSPSTKTRPSIDYTMYVGWEGRRAQLAVWTHDIEILEDYTGPSIWKWEKPVGPLVVAEDRMGREIKKGDFITYILYHHDTMGAGIYFGTVTKVDRDGTVWAKNVKAADDETVKEKRVKYNSDVVILTKDLLDRLMMLKLSSI